MEIYVYYIPVKHYAIRIYRNILKYIKLYILTPLYNFFEKRITHRIL